MFENVSLDLLRDMVHVTLGTLVLGLIMHAVWRFGVRRFSTTWGEEWDGSFSKRPALWGKVRADLMRPIDLTMVVILVAFYYLKFLPSAVEGEPLAGEATQPKLELVLAHFLVTFFLLAFALSTIYLGGRRSMSEVFGLNRLSVGRWILWVMAVAVPATALVMATHYAISEYWLEPKFGRMETQEAVSSLMGADDPLIRCLLLFNACLVAPFAEEVVFRGYIYGTVKRYTGPIFAIVVVGFLFAVVHLNIPATLPLWLFAIILALAYEFSGCLWVPIGIHAAFNTFNVVLMLQGSSGGAG